MSTFGAQQYPYSVTPTGAVVPFEAGPAVEAPPSDLEMQGFWNVLKKIAQGAQTVRKIDHLGPAGWGQPGIDVSKLVGLFEASGPGARPQTPSDLEMQGFWNWVKNKQHQDALEDVQWFKDMKEKLTGSLGVFEAGVPGAGAQTPPSDLEMAFIPPTPAQMLEWSKRFKSLLAGKQLGIFEAGMPGAAQAPSDLEMQGFWNVVRKISTGIVAPPFDMRKAFGLLEAGAPGAGQPQDAPSDLEMQGFWNVLKKIAQGAQTGLNVGKQLGLFESAPQTQTAGVASQEQLLALLQQALPALQAIAQQAQLAPQTLFGPTPGWGSGSSWLSKLLHPHPLKELIL